MDEAFTGLETQLGIVAACRLTGRSRATHYRRLKPRPPAGRTPRPAPPSALSAAERAAILALLNRPEYAELPPAQVWARELDAGNYWCSPSTMYRILRAAGQNGERRRQATHPAKVKPELVADGPSQVWSWDITKLRGPGKSDWYHLYVLIDIYSRYVVGWTLAARDQLVSHSRTAGEPRCPGSGPVGRVHRRGPRGCRSWSRRPAARRPPGQQLSPSAGGRERLGRCRPAGARRLEWRRPGRRPPGAGQASDIGEIGQQTGSSMADDPTAGRQLR
ncbi:hypothetical protein AS97_39805 [Streptomyces sp. AgN23]|nr:hypothetical protein AS97_39805 [Streptomyces sp. AgN23]